MKRRVALALLVVAMVAVMVGALGSSAAASGPHQTAVWLPEASGRDYQILGNGQGRWDPAHGISGKTGLCRAHHNNPDHIFHPN